MASRRKHRAGIPKHAILVDGDWRLPDWRDRVIAVEADDRTIAVKATTAL